MLTMIDGALIIFCAAVRGQGGGGCTSTVLLFTKRQV